MTAQILHSSALMRRAVSTEADDPSLIPHKPKQTISFCTQCGSRVDLHFVGSEHHWRHMCGSCGHIHYENPRNVVGCIVEHHGQILLCKRGIEPQQGLWTLPAGYMELHESSAEGAARETLEEAGARVDIVAPFAHFDIPRISQSYIFFRAKLRQPFTFAAVAPESTDVRLFSLKDIPWRKLAFSAVTIALKLYVEDLERGDWRFHHGVVKKKEGSGPNEPGTFALKGYIGLQLDKAHSPVTGSPEREEEKAP